MLAKVDCFFLREEEGRRPAEIQFVYIKFGAVIHCSG